MKYVCNSGGTKKIEQTNKEKKIYLENIFNKSRVWMTWVRKAKCGRSDTVGW